MNKFRVTMIIETEEEFMLNEEAKIWFDKIFNAEKGIIENVERIKGEDGSVE